MYDIVIIGAGPAGATLARRLGESGLKVIIIDGQGEGNKKPCGGLLAPDAQKALAHFDLVLPKYILVDPQIFSVKTIDVCTKQIRYYSRHYLNINRYAFDKWLVSLVPERVEQIKGKCLEVRRTKDCFEAIVSIGGERKIIKSKQIVGADGAKSLVRKTFFNAPVYSYVAIQQWFESSERDVPFYSCVFDKKTSDSCSWSISKDGSFIFGGCFKPESCRAEYEKQKERLSEFDGFNFENPVKTEACLALRPKKYGDFVTGKDGVYLIGEAAGFISPSSFEGISSAIISGNLLAEAFLTCKAPEEIAKHYRKKAFPIKIKLTMKILKRWFMYTPFVRYWILRTGISSIDLWGER